MTKSISCKDAGKDCSWSASSTTNNVEELMSIRGIKVDHSTIQRWVFKFSKEVEKKVLSHLLDKNLKVQLFFNSKRPMT